MRAAAPPFRFRLIAALFLVLLWAACLDQASGPAGPATFDVLDGRTAPAVTQREIERALPSALRLQSGFTNELLALPGVVGTAVALGDDGLPTVAALVEHGGVSVPPGVRVIVTGRFSAFDWQAQPQGRPKCGKKKCKDPPDEPDPTERHPRPVPVGVSTGHPAITAGTIGARVTDGTDFWALSNNHVYAATNFNADDCTPNPPLYKCMPGDRVIQPGTFDDGALPRDKIGKVTDFEPLNISGACGTIDTNNPDLINIMDAAIAALDHRPTGQRHTEGRVRHAQVSDDSRRRGAAQHEGAEVWPYHRSDEGPGVRDQRERERELWRRRQRRR